jgi:hypothetical protein
MSLRAKDSPPPGPSCPLHGAFAFDGLRHRPWDAKPAHGPAGAYGSPPSRALHRGRIPGAVTQQNAPASGGHWRRFITMA